VVWRYDAALKVHKQVGEGGAQLCAGVFVPGLTALCNQRQQGSSSTLPAAVLSARRLLLLDFAGWAGDKQKSFQHSQSWVLPA
jgi:hypothetical protein